MIKIFGNGYSPQKLEVIGMSATNQDAPISLPRLNAPAPMRAMIYYPLTNGRSIDEVL